MKREDFHREVDESIRNRMRDTGMPMDRMKELARKALDIPEEGDGEVNEEHVAELRKEFPDMLGGEDGSSERRLPKGSMR